MSDQPDFSGVWIKVERAKHHFRDLQARYEGFREAYPYEAVGDDEPHTGDLVYKAKVPSQPPLWWSTIAGDCVHNLRSSLDLLVCEMVRAKGNAVGTDTKFPMFASKTAYANAFKPGPPGQIKGVPQSAVDLIKNAKPYKGADNLFWRLHQLDIADKHKLLVPVGTVHVGTITRYDMAQIFAAFPDETRISAEWIMPPADIVTPRQPFPLKDGAELYRVPARLRSDPVAQMHMNPEFQFEIALGEVEVVKGEPLIPTLHQLVQFVEGFIALFPPLFSQETAP